MQHQPPRQVLLPVPREAAWDILTCARGARLWLQDPTHPGISEGARFPLPGGLSASVTTLERHHRIELTFESGLRAEVILTAVNDRQCQIHVDEHPAPGSTTDCRADGWRALLTTARFVIEQTKHARRSRQAIVVVHGIGNQRPMATVKRFSDAFVPVVERWNKPDLMSASYELRRYQIRRTRHRPRTDLFELYWASLVTGTTRRQVMAWLRSLILRRPRSMPRRLRHVAYLIRLVVVLAIVGVVSLLATIGTAGVSHLWRDVSGWAQLGWVSLALSLVGGLLSGFLITVLGDAVRYLDAAPDNVAIRQSIREAGVSLLRRLHEGGQYDRIVLVGHSLGSVIAYDIIRLYWSEVHRKHESAQIVKQKELDRFLEGWSGPVGRRQHDFRLAQRALWAEYRRLGHPWLISDLVTVGSPLTHAGTVMARSLRDLDERILDGEYPACPPKIIEKDFAFAETYLINGVIRTIRVLPAEAPFALTRWTNIYAPVHGMIFGDPVGGPIADVFGSGILDLPVQLSPWWVRWTPMAHTSYWGKSASHPNEQAIGTLSDAIDFDSRDWLDAHVAGLPWEFRVGLDR